MKRELKFDRPFVRLPYEESVKRMRKAFAEARRLLKQKGFTEVYEASKRLKVKVLSADEAYEYGLKNLGRNAGFNPYRLRELAGDWLGMYHRAAQGKDRHFLFAPQRMDYLDYGWVAAHELGHLASDTLRPKLDEYTKAVWAFTTAGYPGGPEEAFADLFAHYLHDRPINSVPDGLLDRVLCPIRKDCNNEGSAK
jgi:hypothetical protein